MEDCDLVPVLDFAASFEQSDLLVLLALLDNMLDWDGGGIRKLPKLQIYRISELK